jgi:hypothetical protein
MENFEKRLALLLYKLELTPTKFANEIQEDKSKISKYLKGSYRPGMDAITKILLRFPNLNARWLLLGDGEMWWDESKPGKAGPKNPTIDTHLLELFKTDQGQERVKLFLQMLMDNFGDEITEKLIEKIQQADPKLS